MNHRLGCLDKLLRRNQCIKPSIRCRQCNSALVWTAVDDFDASYGISFIDETNCLCLMCSGANAIFRCYCLDTCAMLIDMIDREHPQLLAAAINRILVSGNLLNGLSPPHVADNLIEIVSTILDQSPSVLKFGGPKVVIIADIYETSECTFPILYLSDTVSKPPRCYMHALRYAFNDSGDDAAKDDNNNCAEGVPSSSSSTSSSSSAKEEYLLRELIAIGNDVIHPDSYLVLGSKLQHLISPKNYTKSLHNLAMVVPFDELQKMDRDKERLDITHHYAEVCRSNEIVCKIVSLIIYELDRNCSISPPKTKDMIYADMQRLLTAAIWIKTFSGTPFEVLLYHILNDGNISTTTTTTASSATPPATAAAANENVGAKSNAPAANNN